MLLCFLSHRGYSLHLCPSPPHLKHFTTTILMLLMALSSTPYYITLLLRISNLFWGTTTPFSSSLFFLQFQARCLNSLQPLQSFPFLPSSSSLSLARVYFSLSKLLINELYCCRDMVLHLCKGTDLMVNLTKVTSVGAQDLHPTRHLLP